MRIYVCILLCGFLTGCVQLAPRNTLPASASSELNNRRPPNVVFVMADDLGYGHLGSYGQKLIRTPNLDRMASEGMRFTQYYARSTICAPSRSVLMTGLHTGHTSVRSNSGATALVDADITLAERLRERGYKTGLFGKWGLGDVDSEGVPWQQGFDDFFGYLHQVHAHYSHPAFLWRRNSKVLYPENQNEAHGRYAHDAIMDEAFAWLQQHHTQPFFLYLPVTIPHTELQAPRDALEPYEGRFAEPNPYAGTHHLAPQDKPRTTLAAMVSRLDRDMGRLLGLLHKLGIANDTIVFFTSDNGGSDDFSDAQFFGANGQLRGFKRDLYEGGIRVPMIAWGPTRIPDGRVSDHVWAAWDVLPTVLDLTGAPAAPGLDGRSVLPTLAGQTQPAAPFLYWEVGSESKLAQAARHDDWKAVRRIPKAPLELFNLREDPGESRDVAASNLDVVATIERHLAGARVPPRSYPESPPLYDYERKATGFVW